MKMKRGSNLPDEHHVARHVPLKKLLRDADGNVLGVLPIAFEVRPIDGNALSVNWLEYFAGTQDDQLIETASAVGATKRVGKSSSFAIGNVATIKKTCAKVGTIVRVVYAPSNGNPSHSQIRNVSVDDLDLRAALASRDCFPVLKPSPSATHPTQS